MYRARGGGAVVEQGEAGGRGGRSRPESAPGLRPFQGLAPPPDGPGYPQHPLELRLRREDVQRHGDAHKPESKPVPFPIHFPVQSSFLLSFFCGFINESKHSVHQGNNSKERVGHAGSASRPSPLRSCSTSTRSSWTSSSFDITRSCSIHVYDAPILL